MEPSSSRNPGRTNCTKRTWPAAVFLHQYLSQLPGGLQRSGAGGAWHGTGSGAAAEHGADPRGVSGCAVIELGSGTGWLAAKCASFMAAAATGEASAGAGPAGPAALYCATEMEPFGCIDTLRNALRPLTHPPELAARHNGDDGGVLAGTGAVGLVNTQRLRVVAAQCDWAKFELSDSIVLEHSRWDWVLGSDLYYSEDTVTLFPAVVAALLARSPAANVRYAHQLCRWAASGYDSRFLAEIQKRGLRIEALWAETTEPGVGTANVAGVLAGLEAELAARATRLETPNDQPVVSPPTRGVVFSISLAATATAAVDGGYGVKPGDALPPRSAGGESGHGSGTSNRGDGEAALLAARLLCFADRWDLRCERAWETGNPDAAAAQLTLAQFWSELD